jgi:hypothetical protein
MGYSGGGTPAALAGGELWSSVQQARRFGRGQGVPKANPLTSRADRLARYLCELPTLPFTSTVAVDQSQGGHSARQLRPMMVRIWPRVSAGPSPPAADLNWFHPR